MLSEIFLPYLEFQIKALKFLKAAPYDFNKVTNEVTIAESKFARKFRLIVQILEWVYFFAMCRVVYRNNWTLLKATLFLLSTIPETTCFCVLGRFFMDPCAAPFLGSIILRCQKCGNLDRSKIQWSTWAGISTVEAFHIVTVIHNGFFYSFYTMLVSIYALLQYSMGLGNSTLSKGFKILRSLQILEVIMNDCGKFKIVPSTLVLAPISQIFALLTIIKFHDRIPLPGLLLFPLGYLTVLCGVSSLQTMSGLLVVTTENCISAWKRDARRKSYRRRQLLSLQRLKVKFGNSNFLDTLTTLISQNFCLQQTGSLLIMYDSLS
ncbi:hypothetical protein Fcan01_23097 [Folsomia candida]|uniref:Uncharacterized protein n=1 Tax=Folsomia candida TaxID=158441 RepID=A0A226DAK2_FOLCA|nr:hypothetical protein Fcan01_23097 [Folsomia candida]